jgi:hypothetical protein
MDDRVDAVLGQHAVHQRAIADVANHQFGASHRLAEPGGQIIEHHAAFAALHQLQQRVTADVPGTTRDEYR